MSTVNKVLVAGAGTMGISIAQIFAQKGKTVIVYDAFEAGIEKGKILLRLNQEGLIKNGKITEQESKDLIARMSFTTDISAVKDVDFVTESIFERLDVKHDFWKKASELAREDIVLTSNTSGLSITAIAEAVKKPERFVGMHWFNPPHIIPLIEVISGDKTEETYAQIVYDLSLEMGKKPVKVKKDVPGFAANRVQFAVLRELLHLVEDGVLSYEDADNVMKHGLGLRYACLGPFEIADLGGIDTFSHISDYLFADLDNSKEGSRVFADLVNQGKCGVKSEAGIYDYSNGKADEAVKYRDEMFMKICDCVYN